MLIPFLFFCSGTTALIYEVVWSKYLTLLFGSTVQAQTVVLAVYMGGLAVGNRLVGRRSDSTRQPLVLYGYLELLVGLYAFFFSWIYAGAENLFVVTASPLAAHPLPLLLLKGLWSAVLLGIPTILMGGTLPLLASWLQRTSTNAAQASARFYALNSLGAVFGAWLAGFILIRQIGMVSSLQAAAMANVLIGFTAVGIGRRRRSSVTQPAIPAVDQADGQQANFSGLSWACLIVALTGGLSMGLEVMTSRALTLVFGTSTQAFSIVLMAFIFGIGIAGILAAGHGRKPLRRDTVCWVVLLLAGICIALMVVGVETWINFFRFARTGLARNSTGSLFNEILASVMSVILLGVPAGLIGAVLPLWIGSDADSSSLGDRVGRLLTSNTLGAVVGVLISGFGLMPHFGLRGALGTTACLLCVTSGIVLWNCRRRNLLMLPAALALGIVANTIWGGEGWRSLISSGFFRERLQAVDQHIIQWRRDHIKILFYEDGADATVSVETGDGSRQYGIVAGQDPALRINGKVDATAFSDFPTQQMIGQLPMIARPESKEVFLLGFGCGVTAGALLGHPIDRLTIAENCAPVLRAGKVFEQWNRGALTNSRVRIIQDDARTVLKLGREKYDLLISEPSNPWTIGVGSIFSREFYELAASRMKDDGIIAQWFHVYEINDDLVAMILRTFGSVFPNMEIWDPRQGDLIILGSRKPWKSDPSIYARVFEREIPRADLRALGITRPEDLWARQIASQLTASSISGPGLIQTDDHPILEYDAPEAFYIGANCHFLFHYDERTWQSAFAPPAKRATLQGMQDETLERVFGTYDSVNDEVQRTVFLRLRGETSASDRDPSARGYTVPCVFAPATADLVFQNPSANASTSTRTLLAADRMLERTPEKYSEALNMIISVLNKAIESDVPDFAASDAIRSAEIAVHAAYLRGKKEDAAKILSLALRLVPDAQELNYCAGVLSQNGWIQASK